MALIYAEQFVHIDNTIPKKYSMKFRKKSTAAFYNADHDGHVIACKYRSMNDKAGNVLKVDYMLSTCHNPVMVETGKSNREDNPVMKPTMVSSYNTQLCNIQSLRKSYKWYKKLALQLVMQVMLNAHKVYQIHTGNDMTYLQFLHDTIVLLLAVTPDIPIQVVGDDTLQRLSKRHFPSV